MSTNQQIARIFKEIADLLEIDAVPWEPNAYRQAARQLDGLSKDVKDIYKSGGLKALKAIPCVGESIGKAIEEFIKTGKIGKYAKLLKSVPKGVEQMMHVQGIGPKKVRKIYEKLGIKSLKELEKAIRKGKIEKLEGFGKKSAEELLKGLELVKKGEARKLLGRVWPLSQDIIKALKRVQGVERIEVCGSLRRRRETVRDIDLLAISKKPATIMKAFTTLPNVRRVLAKGRTKSSVTLKDGLNADLRVMKPTSFGAAMQYFTGSKEHNVLTRQIAIKKGYKLNEYGLFHKKTGKIVAARTEEQVYKKLGLHYIAPELRENTGELDAARENRLPELIAYNAVKGDLHVHTRWSDGMNTTEDMVKAAIAMGYKYVAITDHSKSARIANGLDEKRVLKHLEEVRKLRRKHRMIRIFFGAEVDILKDGSLDYAGSLLKKLDIVIASVHSGFKMAKRDMTKRVLEAIGNKHTTIFGHPTARLINERNPIELDLQAVFEAAKKNRVALEINGHPSRLDLRDAHVRTAIDAGCTLCINTDSHSTEHLRFMEFGIATARRGWAEPSHVLNTWPLRKLEKFIKR